MSKEKAVKGDVNVASVDAKVKAAMDLVKKKYGAESINTLGRGYKSDIGAISTGSLTLDRAIFFINI